MSRREHPNVATATAADILDYCDLVGKESADINSNRYAREAGALSAYVEMLCDLRDKQAAQLRRLKETA